MPIPAIRPSHCPFSRISNAASPRQAELYLACVYNLFSARRAHTTEYNPPTRTPRCITSVTRFKVAKFDSTDGNVRKRPLPFRPALRTIGLKDSINVATLPPYGGLTESLAKLRIIFELSKQILIFAEKFIGIYVLQRKSPKRRIV